MNVLNPLNQGRHSELYALEPGRVVKLFRLNYSRDAIEAELQHARSAHALGIPTPRPEGIIETDGRSGIVFERCEGPTLYQMIVTRAAPPARLAQILFDLQRAIHGCSGAAFPDLRQRLAAKVRHSHRAGEALRQRALEQLARLPAGNAACHGDLHPANVIMTAKGPRIVDWLDAGRAEPALDAARSLLLLRFARAGAVEGALRQAFVEAYGACLRDAWGGQMDAIERWQLPVAVARLAEAADDTECENLLKLISTMPSASLS